MLKRIVKFVFIICAILIVGFGIFKYVQSLINKEQVKDLHADMLLVQSKIEMVKGKNSVNSDENPLVGTKTSEIVNQYNAFMEYEKNELNAKLIASKQPAEQPAEGTEQTETTAEQPVAEQTTEVAAEQPTEQPAESQENTYNGPDITLIKQYNISKFIDNNVLTSEEYEKYYLLNDDNLNALDLGELVGRYKGFFIVNYDTYEVVYSEGYENSNGLWCYKISDLNKAPEPANPIQNNEQTENTEEEQTTEGETAEGEQPAAE